MTVFDLEKAACGVSLSRWRAGQERRLQMIREAAGERLNGPLLVDGAAWALIWRAWRLPPGGVGLDIEFGGTATPRRGPTVICGAPRTLPFPRIPSTWC